MKQMVHSSQLPGQHETANRVNSKRKSTCTRQGATELLHRKAPEQALCDGKGAMAPLVAFSVGQRTMTIEPLREGND